MKSYQVTVKDFSKQNGDLLNNVSDRATKTVATYFGNDKEANIVQIEKIRAFNDHVSSIGNEEAQNNIRSTNHLLDRQIKDFDNSDSHTKNITENMLELKKLVDDLDVESLTRKGTFLGIPIPFLNSGSRFLKKFTSSQELISDVQSKLELSKVGLMKDNETLESEKDKCMDNVESIKNNLAYLIQIDSEINERMDSMRLDDFQRNILKEEVLLTLQQKIVDLHTQLILNLNSYSSYQLITKNNLDLIKSINRTQTTTVLALKQAATIATATSNQRIISKTLKGLQDSTSKIMKQGAELIQENNKDIKEGQTNLVVAINTIRECSQIIHSVSLQNQQNQSRLHDELTKVNEELSLISAQAYANTEDIRKNSAAQILANLNKDDGEEVKEIQQTVEKTQ